MRDYSGKFTQQVPVETGFLSKVDKHTCWEWLGAKDKDGYGTFVFSKDGYGTFVFSAERGKLRARRVAWELFKQEELPKLIRHTCDNPGCVNPEHLTGGTQKQNIQDALARDRWPIGEKSVHSKLSDSQALEILRSTETC